MEGCCMFSKERLIGKDIKKVITNMLGIKDNEMLLVEKNDDWVKSDSKFKVIVKYTGFLDEEDDKDDDYYGYHYYDIWYDNKKFEEKLKELEKAFSTEVIIDME